MREHINAFVKTTQELLENPETSKEEEDYIRRERWYATPLPTRHGLETQLGHLSELNGLWYFAPFISDDYAIMQRIHIGVKNTLLAGYTGANAKKQEKPCSITVWSLNKSLCINTTFKKQPGAVLFNTATNTPSGQIFAGPAHHGMLGTLRRVVLALHTMARTPLNQPVGKLAARLASKWHKTYHPITTHINPDDRLLHLPNLINGFPHETAVQIHPDCTPENAGKILEELYQEPNPGTVPPAHPQPPRLRAIRRLCPD